MPQPAYTYDQTQLGNLLANYNNYLNPGANYGLGHYTQPQQQGNQGLSQYDYGIGSILTGGGAGFADNLRTGDYGDALLSLLSGGAGDLIKSLFGGGDQGPQWNPYVTPGGDVVWGDPNQVNPVPLTQIPGAQIYPTDEYRAAANQITAITDLLPYYSRAISAQKIPDAQAQLAADTATTGPRLALQQALQEQYGPIFDELSRQSGLRQAMGSASNDLAVLQGPGKDLIAAALEAAKQYDPEYYQTRTNTANSLEALLGQATANLGKGMTNTERDEVGRGLALSNERAGTAGAPSQLNTVGNAMAFGAAGRARENDSQNQLSKAIAASTAFLPQSRSNVDVFQVATGRPSYNQQDSRFNTNTANGDASANANSLLNTNTSMWTTNQNNSLTRELNQTDWTDTLSAITGALGSVGGLVGMVCWVAREVYGPENPRWLLFRAWVLEQAPAWFRWLYIRYGARFAQFISDKPKLKNLIRKWMDRRIAYATI